MRTMKVITTTAVVLVLAGLTSQVRAGLLRPGKKVDTDGTPYPTGLTLLDTQSGLTFSTSKGLTGTLQVEVFKEAAGTLDFLYQVTDGATSAFSITSLLASNFGDFTTHVNFASDSSSIPGFTAGTVGAASANRADDGSTITFNFPGHGHNPALLPGDTSQVLFIKTDATAFDQLGSALLSGKSLGKGKSGSSVTVDNLDEPTDDPPAGDPKPAADPATAPEPSSLLLAAIGVAGLVGCGWLRAGRRAVR